MEEAFNGYVETSEGLLGVIIYREGGTFQVYDAVAGGYSLTDTNAAEFVSEYGLKLYHTIEDFKRGNSIDAYKVLV